MKNYETILKILLDQELITMIILTVLIIKYMKKKINSDDDLPLKKTLELYDMIIIVRSIFHEGSKYYP